MLERTKRIAIIGSTGSIGTQALEIIAGEAGFGACALAAKANWRLLAEQARRFRPQFAAIAELPQTQASAMKDSLPRETRLLIGPHAAEEAIRNSRPELVLTAVMGSAGLGPTLAAIECKADLAIANKESLVMGGQIVMPAARKAGIRVLPVDSEHSAVFQCLQAGRRQDVRRVILTASGGPFRDWPAEGIRSATLGQALAHPTWQMGRKITIDSATLMNKALEIIEAHWLFDLPGEQIQVLVHPESLVHALVEFSDGSVIAQMGPPSMATPISYALYYPQRAPQPAAPLGLDLPRQGPLQFAQVDPARFPAVGLGYDVIARGGTAGAALNAANEVAVLAFLDGRIDFGQIVPIVQEIMNKAPATAEIDVSILYAADAQARRMAEQCVARLA